MFSGAGIYLGYVGFQNLGDEAMWLICRKRFSFLYWSSYSLVTYVTDGQQFIHRVSRGSRYLLGWLDDEIRHQRHVRLLADKVAFRVAAAVGGEVAMLGGGTLINSDDGYLRVYKELWDRTGRAVPVFGAGVTSPEFMARKPGWTDRRREWVSSLSALPVVGVRGPMSKELLEEAGATNVVVAGDPAVAFHIPLQATSRKPPVDGQRRIGINCGRSRGMIWGEEGLLEQKLAVIARELCRLGHNIEFLAVCPEDMEPCRRVAHQAGFADSSVAPVLSSPARFMAKARSLDLLIAFKLHAAVLAAAANLPFVSLEYRPKCLDFAASIGWQRYSLRTSEVEVDQVSDMVATMLADLPALRAQLCDSMCRLAAQFEQYCEAVEPLLKPLHKRGGGHWPGNKHWRRTLGA